MNSSEVKSWADKIFVENLNVDSTPLTEN